MIRSETLNNGQFIKHYSDSGVMILQTETGAVYEEAIDVVPCRYSYTETELPITSPSVEDKAEAYDILRGDTV